jgi:carboxynorspermidine decarboxylase
MQTAATPTPITDLDWRRVPTPCTVIDLRLLRRNAGLLGRVRHEGGCRVLLALKAYATVGTFAELRPHLDGCCASGPYEARLAREHFGGHLEVFSPAFDDDALAMTLRHCDQVVFNSLAQLRRFRPAVAAAPRPVAIGLRVNPGHSEITVPRYNPCAPGSHLGIRDEDLDRGDLAGVSGLHFHALCEQDAAVLARVLAAFEARFGDLLPGLRWVNLGGGHHLTRADYDVAELIALLRDFRARHPHLTVYLEPGEAVGWQTGVLVASVLDVVPAGPGAPPVAILDTSATCHLPDVLEMPYRPVVHGAGEPGTTPHTHRLAGNTCLAGDVIGDYAFATPLAPGDRVVFADMAHYTTVKTTSFNGLPLPHLATWDGTRFTIIRHADYRDYRDRLGGFPPREEEA